MMFCTVSRNVADLRGASAAVRVTPAWAHRDSGNHFQANATLMRTRMLANTPGTASPKWFMNEPMPGPNNTPALVAADSNPGPLARPRAAFVAARKAGARRALSRQHGVGDVALDDARRSAAEALHEARQKQQPHAVRESEDDVRERRGAEAHEQRWTAAIAVGHIAPHRRGHELRDRE